MPNRVLDWRAAEDRTHEAKYAYSLLQPQKVTTVNKRLALPSWHWTHDQGSEGSCVGHGIGMERGISNTAQNVLLRLITPTRRYDTIDIWNRGKELDEWPDTNPGDDNGTSVHAGYDVALKLGLIRVSSMVLVNDIPTPRGSKPRSLAEGISAVRWTSTVDDVRTAIANKTPVTIGVNWYSNFDNPQPKPNFSLPWIGEGNLGSVRGGHCVCIYGASDRYQAVAIKNSWGRSYPLVWMPYTTLQRLMTEDGEVAIVTDR